MKEEERNEGREGAEEKIGEWGRERGREGYNMSKRVSEGKRLNINIRKKMTTKVSVNSDQE